MTYEEVTKLKKLWGGKVNPLLSGIRYNCPSTGGGEKFISVWFSSSQACSLIRSPVILETSEDQNPPMLSWDPGSSSVRAPMWTSLRIIWVSPVSVRGSQKLSINKIPWRLKTSITRAPSCF